MSNKPDIKVLSPSEWAGWIWNEKYPMSCSRDVWDIMEYLDDEGERPETAATCFEYRLTMKADDIIDDAFAYIECEESICDVLDVKTIQVLQDMLDVWIEKFTNHIFTLHENTSVVIRLPWDEFDRKHGRDKK